MGHIVFGREGSLQEGSQGYPGPPNPEEMSRVQGLAFRVRVQCPRFEV